MIVLTPVVQLLHRGRPIRSAHLISDQRGLFACKELMRFGMGLGLKAGWMRGGEENEHYVLFGKKIDEALTAGAVKVDRHRLAEILAKKRGERLKPVRVRGLARG